MSGYQGVFRRLLPHSVTLRKMERNWEGTLEETASYNEMGFVQYGKRLVTDTKGEEVLASAIVFLADASAINPEHPFWMIDQKTPRVRENMEVIRIDPIEDPRTGRTHHYEVAVR